MKGFLHPILLSQTVVFHYTFAPWTQPLALRKESIITHILPFFVICLNSYTRLGDRWSPSYASMTLRVIDWIRFEISRNPTRTISSIKVSTARDITHMLCVYTLATSFNRWPVSRAATVIGPNWASLPIHRSSPHDPRSSQGSWLKHTSYQPYQVSMINARTSS